MDFDLSIFDELDALQHNEVVKSGTELPGEHSIISTVAAELDFSSGYGTSLDEEIAVSSAISSPLISVPDFDTWYTNQYGSPVADSTVWHFYSTF